MSVFLRLHVDSIAVADGEVTDALKEWKEEMDKEGKRLSELVGFCAGVVGFLRSPRT
jgi:U3 small nucleolar RNA-associated protein 21